MEFRPAFDRHAFLHLPRGLNVLEQASRDCVLEFAGAFHGKITGLVLHDQEEINQNAAEYGAAIRDLGSCLPTGQQLYIEYAVGLEPHVFINLIKSLKDAENIGACLDIGHIGIKQISNAYSVKTKGGDVPSLKSSPEKIKEQLEAVEEAKACALPVALEMIRELGALGKPVHFHLHDGHPLLSLGPFDLSDHLGFYEKIPLPFEWKGKNFLDPMFGTEGLAKIIEASLAGIGPQNLSYTLEMHPSMRRLPLENGAPLFAHWKDLTHAEIMNHWLCDLRKNGNFVNDAITNWLANKKPNQKYLKFKLDTDDSDLHR
jgi:sugar phosphate isomerase/epimerase